jgi:peptide-methionine (S)-S-oxide reductase
MHRLLVAAALLSLALSTSAKPAKATFAGGCFWCMEPPFERLPGVVSVTSGYLGGHVKNPKYGDVSAGGSGHYEAIEIVYDDARVSYERLLDVFWLNVDPTDAGGQFCDRGDQYRTAIFVHDARQRQLATASKTAITRAKKLRIVTPILDATRFYPAEKYHQDYYKKNPVRYKFYRFNCGRDKRLERVWGAAPH